MFGYLGAPCGCGGDDIRAEYRRYFCGLCNVLAREYGVAARWLINRDATALVLLWAAQTEAVPAISLTTCCNPWGARRALYQSGLGIEFAAAVTVAGLETHAADQRVDERGPAQWGWAAVGWVGRPWFQRARRTLDALRFDVGAITRRLAGQPPLEQAITTGGRDWRLAAEPTAAAVGAIFGHQAVLAGNRNDQPRFVELGERLGRVIYWLDASEDFHRDRIRGRFNPLPDVSAAADVLFPELQAASALLDTSPLARYRSLLADVLIRGPQRRARRLLAGPEEQPDPDEEGRTRRAHPVRRRQAGPGLCDPCDQWCAACGDLCYFGDSACQGIMCCRDCCQQRDSGCCGCEGCGDGCCDCGSDHSCDCPCDSGGNP